MAASATPTPSHRRDLWGIRLFFFTLTGGVAMLMPFLPLFYREHGLSGTEIGLLGTLTSIASLVSAPLWGRWSDRASRPRLVLQSALLLTGLCLLVLSRQAVFAGFALVVAVYALLNSGVEPISNRLALQVVEQSGQGGFGSIRLWGSLGWAVMVLVSGWLVEYTGSLLTAFYGAVLFQAIGILFLWIGMVVFINDIARDRGATTLMALYTVTLPALTQMVSGPFSGLIFDRFGAYWLYAIALVGSLLSWAVLSLASKTGSD